MKANTPTISSLKFAQDFGKNHRDVLRTIRTFKCSQEFTERNFALSEYIDTTGRKLPMYNITQQGFTFLISRTTGRINDQYVEAYIQSYEEMAQQIKHAENSMYNQLNQVTLQYMQADQGASKAGRDLNYLGKKVKPPLKREMNRLIKDIQLGLFGGDDQ